MLDIKKDTIWVHNKFNKTKIYMQINHQQFLIYLFLLKKLQNLQVKIVMKIKITKVRNVKLKDLLN